MGDGDGKETMNDNHFGPSSLARYRSGGCEAPSCNVSTQLWVDLHHEIEDEERKSGIHNTESDIRRATSARFMKLYVKDVQTIQVEWSDKTVFPADDLLVTEQGVMTRMGDAYTPAEYEFITKRQEKGTEDLDESKTLRAALRTIVASDDAEVYFPVHNQGPDGNDQIRYVAHWKRVGNRIKTEMIKVNSPYGDNSLVEVQKNLDIRIGNQFQFQGDTPRAYIFARGMQKGQVYARELPSRPLEAIRGLPTRFNITEPLVQRIPDGAKPRENQREVHQIDKRNGKYMYVSERPKIAAVSDRRNTPEPRQAPRTSADHMTKLVLREKPPLPQFVLKDRHVSMVKKRSEIRFISETRVALGAIPVVLAFLAEQPPREVVAVEKSMRRHEKRELRMENTRPEQNRRGELRRKKRRTVEHIVKVQQWKTERVEPLRIGKKEKLRIKAEKRRNREQNLEKRLPAQGKREKRVKKKTTAEKLTPMGMLKPDKQERREKKRLRRAVEKSVRRHKKKELRVKNKEVRRIEKREAKKDSVKVQPLKTESVEPSIEERIGAKLIHPAGEQSGMWVLLSIIWYLTIIREQGRQTVKGKRKKVIPQQAVIFAFQ